MSSNPRLIHDEDDKKSCTSNIAYQTIGGESSYAIRYISSSFVKVQKLKDDFSRQYMHEKNALVELNEQLRLMIERSRNLESENSKYITRLAELRQSCMTNAVSAQTTEYTHTQSNIGQVHLDTVAYTAEIDLFQLESQIYQQMIQVQEQSIHEEQSQLEKELQASSVSLAEVSKSYGVLEQEIQQYRTTRENTFQKYMSLAKEWSLVRKQINEYRINLEMKKTHIQFTKTLNVKVQSLSVDMSDFNEYWKVEWTEIIKRIRHDFELLYAMIRQETHSFYENKIKEIEFESEQIVQCQPVDQEIHVKAIEKLQTEYEQVQLLYSEENTSLIKSQALYSKLESEWQAIQIQNQEKLEAQSNDISYLHENIMIMVSNVEEIQLSKIYLETEIIIYRHILGKSEMHEVVETITATQRKFSVKRLCHGPINIECPIDGTHISLINQSKTVTMDVSRWQLVRYIDSHKVLQYQIPDGFRLKPDSELRIYSKLGTKVSQVSSTAGVSSSTSYQKLVLNDIHSIGVGDNMKTLLFDENDEEKASCLQSISDGHF